MDLGQALQLAFAGSIGACVLWAYRWIYRRSSVIGILLAAGILVRVVLGLALFWVSYLNAPVLRSLQSGGGFWLLAGDARGYYEMAADAAALGVGSVAPGVSSPFFIKTLGLWMRVVGVSPVAGLYLNICLYVVLALMFVATMKPTNDWRRDLPCIIGLSAFLFSPVLIIHDTQPLKDDWFNMLVVIAFLSALQLFDFLDDGKNPRRRSFVLGLTGLSAAFYGLAGIRSYYAIMLWASLAFVLALLSIAGRPRLRTRNVLASLVILCVGWLAFWQGAGVYYRGPVLSDFATPLSRAKVVPVALIAMVQQARTGFWLTGGATNVSAPTAIPVPVEPGTPATVATARGENPEPANSRAVGPLIGLAVVFVPISLLKSLSIVEFAGGRGLLPIADLDTIFLDVSLIAVGALLYTRRSAIKGRLPFVVLGIFLSLLTAALFGYVVTNFGSLFRMRSMVAVPIWALVLAFARFGKAKENGAHATCKSPH